MKCPKTFLFFKLVKYTMIVLRDPPFKRAMLDYQWYRVYLYLINDLKIPALFYIVNVSRTCHSINGRSLEITSLVPLRPFKTLEIQNDPV